MGSLAGQAPPAVDTAWSSLPELNDADYFSEVLQLTTCKSEDALDQELVSKATSLGIEVPTRPPTPDKRHPSSAESSSTVVTFHARTFSSASHGSASTALTTHSYILSPPTIESPAAPAPRRRSKTLSFSQYEKYLAQIDPNIKQPKFLKEPPPDTYDTSGQSLFSVSTRKSFVSIKSGIRRRIRWKKRGTEKIEFPVSCICCRDDFNKQSAPQNLPCGHIYCGECLKIMISQATTDESKMPPRCCTQPVPSPIVKNLLGREEQHLFLKAVLQFSTPWESRVFCPNTACGEFVPPRHKIDPKHPFDVVCKKCRTRVCIMCKRDAHPIGQDCPDDWELDAILKMGEKSGWRRCYKCRTLVELTQGCTHMTCRCKAQFCYICGAVWDPTVGCPNFCNGEEEMERRRMEEQARMAELEAEKAAQEAAAATEAAERLAAEKRTADSREFAELRRDQEAEMKRFMAFSMKSRDEMWGRQAQRKAILVEKFSDQMDKMKERHAKTASHLEDRQIAAEMELRASLDQTAKSVRIRLKHMEAYCDGLGRNPDSNMPARTVTERDLRELGQQYNLRDGMERLHQAKINVMRDRQAKRLEELLERQEQELERLGNKREQEIENLGTEFSHEEDVLNRVFCDRRDKMRRRWGLAVEILRKEMEERDGTRYALMPAPEWPAEGEHGHVDEGALPVVEE